MSNTKFKEAVRVWQGMDADERTAFREWIDDPASNPKQLLAEQPGSLKEQLVAAQKEVERLDSENYKFSLVTTYLNEREKAGIEGVLAKADADRRRLTAHIRELQLLVPWEAIDPNFMGEDSPIRKTRDNGKWQASIVSVTLVARDNAKGGYHFFRGKGFYRGESEVAAAELGTRILEILHPVPASADIPKTPKGFVGFEDDLMQAVIEISMRVLTEDADFKKVKQEQFESLWQKVGEVNFDIDRKDAHEAFNYYVDKAFENYQEARQRYQVAGVKMLFSNSLEEVPSDEEIPQIAEKNSVGGV